MLANIMETYINFTKKNMNEYIKLILVDKFDRKIATEITNAYIDARYYNYIENDPSKTFSKKTYNALIEKGNKLLKKFPKKKEIITETIQLYKCFFYIDGLRHDRKINEIITLLAKKRAGILMTNAEQNKQFKIELYNRVKNDISRRKEFLKKFNTDKFELVIQEKDAQKNVYDISMLNKIDFNDIYKEQAIEHVFNTGLTCEDKLFVEYSLVAVYIANEVIKCNFNTMYLVNYSTSLLKKKRKNMQILNIINNQAVQDKLVLKVEYEEFLKNRFDIYDLMKKGFRFAIVVEKGKNIDNMNLNMFKFIIVSEDHSKLKKYMNDYKNVIID